MKIIIMSLLVMIVTIISVTIFKEWTVYTNKKNINKYLYKIFNKKYNPDDAIFITMYGNIYLIIEGILNDLFEKNVKVNINFGVYESDTDEYRFNRLKSKVRKNPNITLNKIQLKSGKHNVKHDTIFTPDRCIFVVYDGYDIKKLMITYSKSFIDSIFSSIYIYSKK